MQICESMDIMDKLAILTDAAKYDVHVHQAVRKGRITARE